MFSCIVGEKMNRTSAGRTPEPLSKAVLKNLLVLTLGVFISYINSMLIHTFSKHQV